MKRNTIGLDLGTNSIGWAIISQEEDQKPQITLGSRIIPMSQDVIGDFEKGNTVSQTSQRTTYRSIRRLYQRHHLRRERLLRVLHILGFLPPHIEHSIGWDKADVKTYGKFLSDTHIEWTPKDNGTSLFIFQDSFQEMLAEFIKHHPENSTKKIPYDWTVYYLRKKALTQPISRYELAWLLLNFNQKRGYYQLRDKEEGDNHSENIDIISAKILSVERKEKDKKYEKYWYEMSLDNGMTYRASFNNDVSSWQNKTIDFVLKKTTQKDGNIKKELSFLPTIDEIERMVPQKKAKMYAKIKLRTEKEIENSHKTIGNYIYDSLLKKPEQKIIGKLVRTVDREFYRNELTRILQKQIEFMPELSDDRLYQACLMELYPKNENHRHSLNETDFVRLFVDDILFYQRPLKSKKYLIDNCPYEKHSYVDKETGEIKEAAVKCIARSNPYFQEYRLLCFIQNLRILDEMGENCTGEFLNTPEDFSKLYDWLFLREKVSMNDLFFDFFGLAKPPKGEVLPYKWNYPDKDFPANTTVGLFAATLNKINIDTNVLKPDFVYHLWHILYSVSEPNQLLKALIKFGDKHHLPEAFAEAFVKIKPFKSEYGAYSEKAIKKLLSVMRCGSHWHLEDINEETRQRIEDIISGNIAPEMAERIKNYTTFQRIEDFQGLPEWLACYVVYSRHSETAKVEKWETPEDLQAYINGFKQHSLRNPIVEQVILESLRVVHDIWKQVGSIDEIHIELARELRNPAKKRQDDSLRNMDNERRNLRIKLLLMEMSEDSRFNGVRPFSPTQQEILKIYEEGVLLKEGYQLPKEIDAILSSRQPSKSEINRYKLWLEQKYRSPYTGEYINLSRLFTTDYQIEHIIPQARYFDDSLNNKIICEAEVNQDKSNMLAHPYIKQNGGKEIYTSHGKVTILSLEAYEQLVKDLYGHNQRKYRNLMRDDIPESFTQRQINDSRYISKVVMSLLSNIVREEGEKESTAKHLIPCTGSVTDRLKKDWGLNDVWNSLVYPRFERLNQMTESQNYGHWDNKDGKRVFQTQVPLEQSSGFSKKRIDHRHHAMDALVIACASRAIVRYLNNENAGNIKEREQSKHLLVTNKKINKPWNTFTQDAREALQNIVVSFKQNTRIINKTTNKYTKYDCNGKKKSVSQTGENRWAIRKSLHKATVFGLVNLRKMKEVSLSDALKGDIRRIVDKPLKHHLQHLIQNGMSPKEIVAAAKKADYMLMGKSVKKVQVYYFTEEKKESQLSYFATRKPVDDTFDEKTIDRITDTGIQKILRNRLKACDNDPKIAFSPEGIVEMNEHIANYNDGQPHQPIRRVRWAEQASKFAVGPSPQSRHKYVEADKGTNLFFGIYLDAAGNRSYQTIPLIVAIERSKQGLSPVPDEDEKGNKLLFSLSPNDLVYVPTEEEQMQPAGHLNPDRIYKFVSCTGNRAFFTIAVTSKTIADKIEYTALNKTENIVLQKGYGPSIKAVCWKLEVDRLGHIKRVIR